MKSVSVSGVWQISVISNRFLLKNRAICLFTSMHNPTSDRRAPITEPLISRKKNNRTNFKNTPFAFCRCRQTSKGLTVPGHFGPDLIGPDNSANFSMWDSSYGSAFLTRYLISVYVHHNRKLQ